MTDVRDITRDFAIETFSDALRRRVGPRKEWGVDQVSDATGIDRRTIDSYRAGEAAPCFSKLLQIAAVLGPGFISEIMAPAEQVSGARGLGQTVTGLSDLLAHINHRIHDDGQFCHQDRMALGPQLIEIGAELEKTGSRWAHGLCAVPHEGKVCS